MTLLSFVNSHIQPSEETKPIHEDSPIVDDSYSSPSDDVEVPDVSEAQSNTVKKYLHSDTDAVSIEETEKETIAETQENNSGETSECKEVNPEVISDPAPIRSSITPEVAQVQYSYLLSKPTCDFLLSAKEMCKLNPSFETQTVDVFLLLSCYIECHCFTASYFSDSL